MIWVDEQGNKFEAPESPNEATRAEIIKRGLKPLGETSPVLKDVAKSAVSGLAEGAFRGPLWMADLGKLGGSLVNKVIPGAVDQSTLDRTGSQGWIDAFKDSPQDRWLKEKLGLELSHEPTTSAGRYAKAGTSGISSAVTSGGGRQALSVPSLLINGAAGTAAEAGTELSGGDPLVGAAAGLVTGTGGNLVRNSLKPNVNQLAYNATKNVTAPEWEAAGKSRGDFERSGSQSFTLADLPQLQPKMGGMAVDLAHSPGGNLLAEKLNVETRFNKDIPQLLNKVRDAAGPPGDQRELVAALSAKGKGILDPLEQAHAQNLKNLKDASKYSPPDVPRYAQTLQDFSANTLEPVKRSVTGQAATASDMGGLIARLRQVPPGKLVSELNDLGVTRAEAQQIARSIAQGIDPMPNITTAARNAGIDRKMFLTILEAANPAAAEGAANRLGVVDQLGKTTVKNPSDRLGMKSLGNNPLGLIMNPFNEPSMRMRLRTTEKETSRFAEMLGNPTPENLERLKKLAEVDPRAARMMQWIGSLVGSVQNSGVRQATSE